MKNDITKLHNFYFTIENHTGEADFCVIYTNHGIKVNGWQPTYEQFLHCASNQTLTALDIKCLYCMAYPNIDDKNDLFVPLQINKISGDENTHWALTVTSRKGVLHSGVKPELTEVFDIAMANNVVTAIVLKSIYYAVFPED